MGQVDELGLKEAIGNGQRPIGPKRYAGMVHVRQLLKLNLRRAVRWLRKLTPVTVVTDQPFGKPLSGDGVLRKRGLRVNCPGKDRQQQQMKGERRMESH